MQTQIITSVLDRVFKPKFDLQSFTCCIEDTFIKTCKRYFELHQYYLKEYSKIKLTRLEMDDIGYFINYLNNICTKYKNYHDVTNHIRNITLSEIALAERLIIYYAVKNFIETYDVKCINESLKIVSKYLLDNCITDELEVRNIIAKSGNVNLQLGIELILNEEYE